jgi:ribosomal protein L11 methyltransferase
MHWFNLTASSSRSDLDQLESWFWERGAVSVTVEDGEDNPIYEPPPGEQPVWDEVLVTGLFESSAEIEALQTALRQAGFEYLTLDKVEDRPWEREWLSRFEPMQFGRRLWVCPTGYDIPAEAEVIIHLDPGLAFGTGTHETTRLCLEYLDGEDLTGATVIDYGCGSGILAIGAALLGARSVIGIDNDPQALTATAENAKRNEVKIVTSLPGKMKLPNAELVLANILAQPLVELADALLQIVPGDGRLVLSGIMSSQADWVIAAYEGNAELLDKTELNGWVRLVWGC